MCPSYRSSLRFTLGKEEQLRKQGASVGQGQTSVCMPAGFLSCNRKSEGAAEIFGARRQLNRHTTDTHRTPPASAASVQADS